MIIQDPLMPKIGNIVKPRYNMDKFVETYSKYKNTRQNFDIALYKQIYDNLIRRNYCFINFSSKDSNLCCCHVDEESLGWIVPIQCLKRVKV